jgi:hypothetical protein
MMCGSVGYDPLAFNSHLWAGCAMLQHSTGLDIVFDLRLGRR